MEQCAVRDCVEGFVEAGERRDVVLDKACIRQPAVLRRLRRRGDRGRGQVDPDHFVAVRRQRERQFGESATGVEHNAAELPCPYQRGELGLWLSDVPRRRSDKVTFLAVGAVPIITSDAMQCTTARSADLFAARQPIQSGPSQVWTGSLLCIRSQYSRSISASAFGRVRPRSCNACTVDTCHAAPLRPVLARPSITPRYRSRTSLETSQRRRPSSAIGSNWRSTSSSGVTSPRPGQYSLASMPCCAAARKLCCAAAKLIFVHSGRSSSDSVRSMP